MTRLLRSQPRSPKSDAGFVPPLENGDRLTAKEFHRRYLAMPHVKKAELIRGIVYMPSPVRLEQHATPHARLVALLGVYEAHTPGITIGDNSTIMLDDSNEPQSDICLAISGDRGGQSKVIDGYLVGAPEFVAEVAASSVSYDLHQKLDMYAEFGVREYVVWRVLDREFDWFLLKNGLYEPVEPDQAGTFRSQMFPGLWIAGRRLIDDDAAGVHEVLQQGIRTQEHAEFCKSLDQKGTGQ